MSKETVNIQELHMMYKKAFVIANELVEDALTLYKKGSYARAYYLSQAAFEEFGKLNMLYVQALKAHNKEKIILKEMVVRLSDKNIDDDLGYGIVLLIEKDLIKYPTKMNSILHQTDLKLPETLSEFENTIIENAIIVNVLEIYKELKAAKVFTDNELSRELYYHVNKLREHLLKTSYLEDEFVMPSEIVTAEQSKKRLMSVLTIKRIYQITGYQQKSFDLFKFGKKHYRDIESTKESLTE